MKPALALALLWIGLGAAAATPEEEAPSSSPPSTETAAEAPSSWKGPYLGVVAGKASGEYRTGLSTGPASATRYFTTDDNVAAVDQSGGGSLNTSDFTIGLRGGVDWELGKYALFGAVVDYGTFDQVASRDATGVYPTGGGNFALHTTLKADGLLTLRGRLGVLVPQVWRGLVYFTAGLALTKLTYTNTFQDDRALQGAGSNAQNAHVTGSVVGAGIEFPLCESLSLNGEWLYASFASLTASGTVTNTAGGVGVAANSLDSFFNSRLAFSSSLLRLGVQYRFRSL